MSDTRFILYGMSASLFTGKARAYLLHNGVPFVERGAGHPEFTNRIVPAIGRWIIPVLEMPDGTLIQDGTDIIDRLDADGWSRRPVRPMDPVLAAIAHLFELFGGEGLLRPAMHYRWNFDAQNLAFLRENFAEAFPPGLDATQRAAMFDQSSGRMRKAGRMFGVTEETAPTIETAYADFLSRLEAHLSVHPFLLGGHPTLGDYGLMNGLYAHLARDPAPSLLMKRDAPNVFAWTERMNRTPRDEHRFADIGGELLESVPDTLISLMTLVAEDFLPEWIAHARFIDDWVASQAERPVGKVERVLGMAEFDWRGHSVRTAVMPYRSWLTQRLTDRVDAASPEDQNRIRTLFEQTNLLPLLDHRPSHRVKRVGNQEVWGALA